MAKYNVTVQYANKKSTVCETDDETAARNFLSIVLVEAKKPGFDGQAIFYNKELKWRKR